MRLIFVIIMALMVSISAFSSALTKEQEKNITSEKYDRLAEMIAKGCSNNQKTLCSAKRCLKEDSPLTCYQEVMASSSFEDRIADHKALCEKTGNAHECGLYCGMLERPTDFCLNLYKQVKAITLEQHLATCKQGITASCGEFCRMTVKNLGDQKKYSQDLLDCELRSRKK